MTFATWCAGENERRVLVDVYPRDSGDPVHVRISDETYVDDIPRVYQGRLTGDTVIERSIGGVLGMSASSSGGELHVANPDGALDGWLDYAWAGQPISIRAGSPDWSTNVADDPLTPASWSGNGSTVTDLVTQVLDYNLAAVESGGQRFHRRFMHSASAGAGEVWRVSVLYRRGSSKRMRLTARNNTESAESQILGRIGVDAYGLVEHAEAVLSSVRDEDLGWARRISATVTWTSAGTCTVGIGPDTTTVGDDIIVLGGTVEVGTDRFEPLWNGVVDRIDANDTEIVISLRDRSAELDSPILTVVETRGVYIGGKRPICYGWPKNIAPVCHDPDSDPEYRVHELWDVEDAATTRYINQAPSTSPTITKRSRLADIEWDSPDFSFATDPGGPVTCDTKGARVNGVHLQKPGECVQHILTRSFPVLVGLCKGGTDTTIILPDDASDEDDYYNSFVVAKSIFSETGKNDIFSRTISDYVGATRTATVSLAWTDASNPTAIPVDGDGILIDGRKDIANNQLPDNVRYGPLGEYDLDTDAFSDLDTDLPYPVGIYIDDSRSGNQMLTDVLGPVAFHGWTRAGQLTVGKFPEPTAATADRELTDRTIIGDIEIEQDDAPVYRLRYGYDLNHTVQSAGSTDTITPVREAFIRRDYEYSIREDRSILSNYPEARDIEVGSVYIDQSDSENNRNHLWALHSVPREWLRCATHSAPWAWELGEVVEITDDRHGLSGGKNYVLARMSIYPLSDRTDLELWG